jgi:hypothetical protein
MMKLEINFWRNARAVIAVFFVGVEVPGRKGLPAGFLSFNGVMMFREIGGRVAGGGGYRQIFLFSNEDFRFSTGSVGSRWNGKIPSVVCGVL